MKQGSRTQPTDDDSLDPVSGRAHTNVSASPAPAPHLPLRKASAQRLRTRGFIPHPLFITSRDGSQGFSPATSLPTAEPSRTPASAGRFLDPFQDERKRSFETIVPSDVQHAQRKDGWASGTNTLQWEETGFPPPRKGSKPALRSSRSMTEGLRGLRERLAKHRGHDPAAPASPSLSDVPFHAADDVRTSFRSALTSNSSFVDSYTSTDRSSMATGNSSTSDFVEGFPNWQGTQDENLSVEDAIGMYANGFDTPLKQSFDAGRHSISRPSSSPQIGADKGHARQRSQSVIVSAAKPSAQEHGLGLVSPSQTQTQTQPSGTTPLDASGALPPSLPPVPKPIKANQPIPRDRYGFKKKSHYITVEQFNAWEGPYNAHVERRRKKWDALMAQYGLTTHNPVRFPPKNDKVKRYIRKGVPPEWRGAAWFWYAGGPGLQKTNEGLYFRLLERVRRGGALSDSDKEHIERDLNRTFPDNIRFKPDPAPADSPLSPSESKSRESTEPETDIVRSLRRVLQAFAVHNPNIGYCQSLNFIAGLLLLFLDEDEEKAFILLNVVTTQHLPGTHGVSLEGANIDIAVLMRSLKDSLPTIWAKIDDRPATAAGGSGPPDTSDASLNSTPLPTVSLATTAWFMSLFVGTLPIESVLRVWDCLFFEGSKTLFRIALAIFKQGEQQIRAVSDPMEVFQVVQGMPRAMLDVNALMETCFKRRNGFGGLSQEVVERRRNECRNEKRLGRTMTGDLGPKKSVGKAKGVTGRLRSKTKGG